MVGSGRKIDEGKNGAPVCPSFFPLVFLFSLAAYDLTCSPLSKRLEQATYTYGRSIITPDKKNI